jgi:integrase
MAEREKLTKRSVESLVPHPDKEYFIQDSELLNFAVRVYPSGQKVFVVRYRVFNSNQQRRAKIGTFGPLTVEEARKLARVMLGRVASGEDPAGEKKAMRKATTVNDLLDAYFAAAESGKVLKRDGRQKNERTLRNDRGRMDRHVRPLIGRKPLSDVSPAIIRQMQNDITDGRTAGSIKTGKFGLARVRGGSGAAGGVVRVLKSIFSWGTKTGRTGSNPCVGVETAIGEPRDRFLNADEYRRLYHALQSATHINPTARAAIQALALTGARKNEILTLRPSDVDRGARGLRLQSTKTGRQLRPCSLVAMDLLENVEATNQNWIFPSARNDGPIVNLRKPLIAVMKQAGLEDVTAHTLRHSFASVASELDFSEITIAGLLGHTPKGITQRYAHRVDSAVAAAADRVASTILARMMGRDAMADILKISERR